MISPKKVLVSCQSQVFLNLFSSGSDALCGGGEVVVVIAGAAAITTH